MLHSDIATIMCSSNIARRGTDFERNGFRMNQVTRVFELFEIACWEKYVSLLR